MILVIGPMAAGKREFVSGQLGYGPEEMADGRLDDCPVIFNVQDLVFRDPAQVPALLPQLTAKAVVVINEVGAGVIPL